jgi:hypothetical protein
MRGAPALLVVCVESGGGLLHHRQLGGSEGTSYEYLAVLRQP